MASVAAAASHAVTGRGLAPRRAAPGSSHPRFARNLSPGVGSPSARFTGTTDGLLTRTRLRRRVRARGTEAAAVSSAATSSDGGGVAIVGLGARGCAVVDRLVSRGALRGAQFWSLSADPNALQAALAPNRWRLPPGTVDPKDSAVEENVEAVARGILNGGVANVPPAVVVVVASASEAKGAPSRAIEAIARLKDGPSQRGWFNVGGSQGITHRGPAFIVAAMTPFQFEGPRKTADAVEALLHAQKCADAVAVVPQEALTGGVSGEGDPLTVQEVTELADATAQWSAFTIMEMFRSPAWIGLDGAASESPAQNEPSSRRNKSGNRPWRFEPNLSPETFRNLVAGRPSANAKLGCGTCVVGYGTSTLELNFAPDEGQSAAIRIAAYEAAENSPFLRRRVFANAEFACASVQTSATLTEAAVRAASDVLRDLVGPAVPQIVSAAKPDPRAPPDQVLVTILVAAQPEEVTARDSRSGDVLKKDRSKKLLGMSFPAIPGAATRASPSVESVGRAAREEREQKELLAREEAEKKRPAQRLTGDMLRKLGLSDPARMLEEREGNATEEDDEEEEEEEDDVSRDVTSSEVSSSESSLDVSEDIATLQKPNLRPPLLAPPKSETVPMAPAARSLPMPSPQDVARAVAPPETRASAGAKFSGFVDVPPETFPGAPSKPFPERVEDDASWMALEARAATVSSAPEAPTPANGEAEAAGDDSGTPLRGAVSRKEPFESTARVVPLPAGMTARPVAVRILEVEEDPTGKVIGYKAFEAETVSFDSEEDAFGDGADSASGEKRKTLGGLFGFGAGSSDAGTARVGEKSKDLVKNRLASVLDRDRSGSIRQNVRLEYAGNEAYEGEWFGNKPEGVGKRVFAEGDVYEGRFRDGLPDGRGVLTYARGGYFRGTFFEGKPNGPGTLDLRDAGGEETEGRWVDGVLEIASEGTL